MGLAVMGTIVIVFAIWFLYDIAKSQNKSLFCINDVKTLFDNLGRQKGI